MTQAHCGIVRSFPATALEARNALEAIMGRLRSQGLAEDQVGGVEIALAEAVNNIVEHAYADMPDGDILVRGCFGPTSLTLHIIDHGRPLPEGRLPDGQLTQMSEPPAELPEGGFGWFLIRTLVRDIRYLRENGENHLRLIFDLIPPSA